jgi:Zn finger protein HypA/HybF involved in hydrogenase expression
MFRAIATIAPNAIAPSVIAKTAAEVAGPPLEAADLSTTCPSCATQMQPEHAHYRCPACGYRDSCCF